MCMHVCMHVLGRDMVPIWSKSQAVEMFRRPDGELVALLAVGGATQKSTEPTETEGLSAFGGLSVATWKSKRIGNYTSK